MPVRHHDVGQQQCESESWCCSQTRKRLDAVGRLPEPGSRWRSSTARVKLRTGCSSSTSRMVSVPPRVRASRRRAVRFVWSPRLSGRKTWKVVPRPTSLSTSIQPRCCLTMPIDRGQAEARAFARLLGGEERLEDARQIFRRNAAAGVGDAQADVTSGPGVRYRGRLIRGETLFGGFNEQAARRGAWRRGR